MKTVAKYALVLGVLALVVPLLGVLAPAGVTVSTAEAADRQSGRTVLTPQVVHPGARVAAADKARLSGTVRFRPAREGRPVVLQRRIGKGPWQTVVRKRQNRRGAVAFAERARNPKGRFYTYRGVALRWKGLRRIASSPQHAGVWKLGFGDEFKGTRLDLDTWSYRQLGDYNRRGDRACSTSRKRAVQVGNGRLRLQVRVDWRRQRRVGPCVARAQNGSRYSNRHWYMNGHVSTEPNPEGHVRYGVAAARVKFDRPKGAHGAFWLQSTVPYQAGRGPARNGAEIDVVEYFGKEFKRGDVYSVIHYRDAKGRHHKVPGGAPITAARRALEGDDDWFRKYHVFSVEWTPKAYVFRVDGIQTLRITRGVSRVPEFLVLSMLSSGWQLEKMDRRTLPNATHVDWVRHWQR